MSADWRNARNGIHVVSDRLDLVLQPLVAIGFVADEVDLLDAGLVAFLDLEHEIDAVVRKLDDLRLDADVEAAVAPVDFDDALHVGLHGRTRQRAAGLRLHFVGELVVLELRVAFERDPVDHRIFDHRDDQPGAGLVDAHVLEQAGGIERLERLVDLVAVEAFARVEPEVGADGLGLDPPVAFDDDRARGLRGRIAGGRDRPYCGAKSDPGEDHADQAKTPKLPHPQIHSQRALFNPFYRLIGGIAECTQHHVSTGFFPVCNPSKCRHFPLFPRKCPQKRHSRRPKPRQQLNGVIKDCKYHQHHDNRETDAKPDFLGPRRQRTAPDRLNRVEQKVTAIEQRHREQVQQPDRNRQHGRQMQHRHEAKRGDLAGNLRDPDRPAELVGAFAAGEQAADIGERPVDDEPGFLGAEPDRR